MTLKIKCLENSKLGTAFEVDWLKESCRDWFRKKMKSASSKDDKIYLFEECWFITDTLKDEDMMDDLVSVLAHEKNSSLLSHYFSDLSKVKEAQIDVLMKLSGVDVKLLLNIILKNLRNHKTLDSKFKYTLDNMNLALCSETNERLYLKVMDTVSELSEISVDDLKWAYKLMTNTARLVSTRTEEKKERSTVLFDKKKNRVLLRRCKTVTDIINAVSEDLVTSMFVVIDLLLYVFSKQTLNSMELQVSTANLTEACVNKKIQKVSQYDLKTVIAGLRYSNLTQSKQLITLLTEIKKSDKMCTKNENVIIKLHRMITVTKDQEYKLLYLFKHPLYASACPRSNFSECGFIMNYMSGKEIRLCIDRDQYRYTGIHLHHGVSTRDMHMCYYATLNLKGANEGNQITVANLGAREWWKDWLPHLTDWKFTKGFRIAYNLSGFTVTKQKKQ